MAVIDRAATAHVLREAGHDVAAIAVLLSVTESQVYRYLAAYRDQPVDDGSSAVANLNTLLEGQDLDAHAHFQAGVARSLALRLDAVSRSDKAQDAMAMPQIAKELRAVVAEIMGASQDDKEWLAGLLTQMGHAQDN